MKNILFIFITAMIWGFSHTSIADEKKIGILVFDGVLSSDITAPLEVFGVASRLSWFSDYKAITIAISQVNTIKTEEGLRLGVDTWIGENPDIDVLLVPSSYSMKPLINNKRLINFIKDKSTQVDWLASNCSGAFLLAEAGLLDGKHATTWSGGEESLQKQYPNVKVQFDKNVVIDGQIVTSNGSLVSYQAALSLLSLMSSNKKAAEVADALQYSRFSSQQF